MAAIRGLNDNVFEWTVRLVLLFIGIVILFPLFFVVSASVTPYEEVIKNGGFMVIPGKFSAEAYLYLFRDNQLIVSFGNTLFITLVGTVCNMLVTILTAWPLSRKNLPGRSGILVIITFTLMFSGGTIPTYLVVRGIGLIDSLWALIIPSLIWTSNCIIMKNFMESLPEELIEAAIIDGASDIRILTLIAVPLSGPIITTISIYYGVAHWNEFFGAILYITSKAKMPVQVIVRDLLNASLEVLNVEQVIPTMTLQMASVVAASLPIILAFPFIQKAFVRGIMSGAIKG
jgi:putative aldouronate transport system permease protein